MLTFSRVSQVVIPVIIMLAAARTATALEEVPYVPTPQAVVDAILTLGKVGPRDLLYDLGSGDGRIVITAAQRFGTRGLGVELSAPLVERARAGAAALGVSDRATFAQKDLFETDLRPATVITMYLLPDVNLALRDRLLATLRPGTRLVSHDFDMGEWRPDEHLTMPAPGKTVGIGERSDLYLWIVPARLAGTWHGTMAGQPIELALTQRFQDLSVAGSSRGKPIATDDVQLSGGDMRLKVAVNGVIYSVKLALRGQHLVGTGERPTKGTSQFVQVNLFRKTL